jgi:hypothetical protein
MEFRPVSIRSWFKLFKFWSPMPKIESVDQLIDFIHTRSIYVAQRSLYGYLKTRMGTRFREFFEDDEFSRAIRTAAVKVAAGCLSDLTIYTVAKFTEHGALSADEADRLARHCYQEACVRAFAGADYADLPAKAADAFRIRSGSSDWASVAQGENAFSRSPRDLVRYAPVIDEYKDLDREIVMNSIRFRWNEVREQFAKAFSAAEVHADWLRRFAPPAEQHA